MLAACGGGGGTSGSTGTAPNTLTVTGTGATGIAIAGATVTAKCKVGTGSAITQADGSYTLSITDGQLPCVLEITNPVGGVKLHSVVFGTGRTANGNITPLTEMATARVLGSEPNVFFAAFDATVATQKITSANVQTAQTDVGLILAGAVDTTALGNFMSVPLKAATQGSPTSGDAQDKLLDALKLKLSSANIGTLTTAMASSQTTDAIKLITTSLTSSVTTPPVANAGATQNVLTGTIVTLDGSASSAAIGKTLTYTWTLTTKPSVSSGTLSMPTSAKPTFVADVAGLYVASVIVNDGISNSSAAAVTITAAVANVAPVANAGVAQNVVAGSVVTLDGSTSSDANGDSLTYVWTLTAKPAGSSAALSSSTSPKPTFTADVAGTYVASLAVNDGKVGSNNATVSVTAAVANVAPVANAGVAQNVVAGSVVTLDGSTSSDANGFSLTYAWTLTGKPAGSIATLSSSTTAKPTFTADFAGTYVGTLTVNNGKSSSTSATVSIAATATSLSLYELSTSIFSPGETLDPMPYSSTASVSASVTCVGSGCSTVYDVASFKLKAVGQGFTISNLRAVNLTSGSPLAPTFGGLADEQVIAAGTTVAFKLQSPFTSHATVILNYSFTVLETGKTFNYTVNLQTN
jgi:hypothetical protein